MIEKIHLALTLYMTGVIWFVQIVHYPLFDAVKEDHDIFARRHQDRTGFVVAPAMLGEAFCAILLLMAMPTPFWICNLALIGLIWMVTFAISVPCHQRLQNGFDPKTHRRLVRSNWFRTIAWTTRSIMLLIL